MFGVLLKGEKLLLRLSAIAGAIMVLAAFYAFVLDPAEDTSGERHSSEPKLLACDSLAQPVTERLSGSLARLDCSIPEIELCDFEEIAQAADQTSHGQPSHLMRLSIEIDGERLAIVGNGRGATAEQAAFDGLFNNLKLVLEERKLCK